MRAVEKPSKHERSMRHHKLTGSHSAACRRQKHEDWQHGMQGCAVGNERSHCDCEAHWVEVRGTAGFGQ